MPISALPTPPSRSDAPQDFSDRADALLGALPGFVTEANALQSDVNAKEASASSYATIAANNAAEAAASAVAAAAAASNAEIAFDSFDDRYLGSKASDPTTDNDGNPLLTGALYWNTTATEMRVWNGSSWQVAVGSLVGNADTATKLQTPRTITIGNTGKSFDGSANVSWSLAQIGATNANGDYIVRDTRDENTPTNLGAGGVRYEFKYNTTDGLYDGGMYHSVMTVQNWNDPSGGNTHQLGFTNNGNLWLRTAPIGGTWGPWQKIYHSVNLGVATESSAGLVELANTAEARALTSAGVALTPARLADAFTGVNQSLTSNGYQKLPGGVIIQWGVANASDPGTIVTFPVAFPTACIAVTAMYGQTGDKVTLGAHTFTTTTFRLYGWDFSTYWIAVGY